MKKTIINEYQLDHLVDIGVLYKTRDGAYEILINNKVWGYVCMPKSMVKDVAGKTIDVRVDKVGADEAERWITNDEKAWYIQIWMLTDYYDKIKQWGKCRPVPYESGGPGGEDKYHLQIISQTHLEDLVNKGIVTKETLGDCGYVYKPVITDMGQEAITATMVEQLCGKTLTCEGTGTTWIEQETEHRWTISQWMLEHNYEYLLSRLEGCLDPEQLEDEEDDEEDDEEEDTSEPRNFVNLVGEIVEKSEDVLTLAVPEVTVLVHITDCDYGVGQHVSVKGYLVRTSNMMGYPEIKCNYIQEV